MVNKNIIQNIPVEYRYLGFIMSLPLLDGVFISIILSNGLTNYVDAILVGGFIIGGGASIGVILSEFDGNMYTEIKRTIIIGIFISILAIFQAATAPIIEPLLNINLFKYGSMIALIALAYKISPIDKTIWIIEPGIIIVFTFLISVNIQPIDYTIMLDYETAWYAFISSVIATGISILTIIYKLRLRELVNKNIIKYITSLGLIIIALSIPNIVPEYMSIIVFIVGFSISIYFNKK